MNDLDAEKEQTNHKGFYYRWSTRNHPWEEQRWSAFDPQDEYAGEFPSEQQAMAAIKRWGDNQGSYVLVAWTRPPEDSDDSNRGTYTIKIKDTNFAKRICSGWGTMEESGRFVSNLRDMIAKHGIEAISEILEAVGN
jgi:hypothetical protein